VTPLEKLNRRGVLASVLTVGRPARAGGRVHSTYGPVTAWLLDFTALAESHGWRRIPAQTGWAQAWQKREFWHYQHVWADKFGSDPYDRLMAYLYPNH
jgi:hypothetical protein